MIGDFSSVYSDIGGPGNVEATKMAIEDFGGTMFGKPIELITADVLNKADIAASLARKWYENEGVDMIIDMPTSATALAGMELSKQFEKIMIVTDAASSDITGKSCSPYTAHWTYDTYSNAHTVGSAIVKNGGDSWFFITADYVFGHSIERDTGDVVSAAGGKVVGSVKHPLNTRRLLVVPAAGAGLEGQDHRPRQWRRRHHQRDQAGRRNSASSPAARTSPAIVMFISDVHSLGLKLAQGLIITEAYYWDLNDKTRAFGKRFFGTHEAHADDEPGRDLQRDAALSQGRARRPAPGTPSRCWRRCARRRCATPSPTTACCARTAAWCTACSCSR